MSGSRNAVDSFSKRSGKAPEKSNFAHTCNLLSQFVKERGTLRNLNLAGISVKPEATAGHEEKSTSSTLNLLGNIENSCQLPSQLGKSVEPFSGSAPSMEFSNKKACYSMEEVCVEPKGTQMTIFYAGEVMVFDDFPAEKAKEIMLLAAGGGSSYAGNVCGIWKTPYDINAERFSPAGVVAASSSKEEAILVCKASQESLKQPQAEANTSDLPIARRSSLHRFLAKRKDRAVARGPYQLHNNNNDRLESSSKNDQEQLELKL